MGREGGLGDDRVLYRNGQFMKINLTTFNELVDQKYLSVQKHEQADLLIWNYTQFCQFDRKWTEETMMARGLITDLEGNIVARPFKKFFNYEEYGTSIPESLPVEQFYIQEKYDGSLGILYWIGDKPYLATRGSFVSDQAIKGTEMLQGFSQYFDELNRNYTYLFEIIYPENRIVVDYGGKELLPLLAVIDTETGKDLDIYAECSGFPFAGYIDGITDLKTIKAQQKDNKEGFVIRFVSGLRVKLKFEEYVRLHRLVTGVNARSIWDLLRNNQPFDELLDRVPDEFYSWVKKTKEQLKSDFMKWELLAREAHSKAILLPTRKEQAIYLQPLDCRSIVFRMLDEKPHAELIWKMLRPSAVKPFKEDES